MSNCIFCKIITGDVPSTNIYQDDKLIIIKDIKPVAEHHYLAIPKKHIANVNALTLNDKELVEKLIQKGKEILIELKCDLNDSTFGFHMPPFNTVSHLHLHVICPKSSMSWFHRLAFKPYTWWFNSDEQVLERLGNSKL